METKYYNFIIIGAGVSGLVLASKLVDKYGKTKSILFLDKQLPTLNNKNICFWAKSDLGFNAIINKKWNKIKYKDKNGEINKDTGNYNYYHSKGKDLYKYFTKIIKDNGDAEFIESNIGEIKKNELIVDDTSYTADYIFDSRFETKKFSPGPKCFKTQQRILGWTIETETDAFEENTVTFLDMKLTNTELEFFYLLPFNSKHALVECVQYYDGNLTESLNNYIHNQLQITNYKVLAKEQGITTLTDCNFQRIDKNGVVKIGAAGGQVKPTTGYSLVRIIEDSKKIVEGLDSEIQFRRDNLFYRLCDSIFLYIMIYNPQQILKLYRLMFSRITIDRIFKFLDQQNSPIENGLFLLTFYPYTIFLQLLRMIKIKLAS